MSTELAAAAYQLMDTDSASLLGSYSSEREALLAVAAAAEKHGHDSEAVLNLVLFREDGPEDEAHVAGDEDLVVRALRAAGHEHLANADPSIPHNGTARPTREGSKAISG